MCTAAIGAAARARPINIGDRIWPQRGYAGFTISYRLTKPGRKTYPEAVHDVRAAVQFMRGRANEFRLDPDRFALWGNSAGAQLAALVALAGDSPLFAGGYPRRSSCRGHDRRQGADRHLRHL